MEVHGIGCRKYVFKSFFPPEQLNKANTTDTEAPFLDLHLSIASFYGFVSSKIYDKRDDFDFDIENFPFLDGVVPYYVYVLGLLESAIM